MVVGFYLRKTTAWGYGSLLAQGRQWNSWSGMARSKRPDGL